MQFTATIASADCWCSLCKFASTITVITRHAPLNYVSMYSLDAGILIKLPRTK